MQNCNVIFVCIEALKWVNTGNACCGLWGKMSEVLAEEQRFQLDSGHSQTAMEGAIQEQS